MLRGAVAWSLLPNDLPPKSTVFGWFSRFRDTYVFEKVNHALVAMDRELGGREASPSAAIIDSQSVKTTESGGPHGYDAGKKIKGRKRRARSIPLSKSSSPTAATPGERVARAIPSTVEIVRRIADQLGFVVLPRRWVVERFVAWINRNRRLAKDVEATIASARAFLYAAAIMLLVRRIGRTS